MKTESEKCEQSLSCVTLRHSSQGSLIRMARSIKGQAYIPRHQVAEHMSYRWRNWTFIQGEGGDSLLQARVTDPRIDEKKGSTKWKVPKNPPVRGPEARWTN